MLWGLCLGLAAMLMGVGMELHSSGSGPIVTYPIVVGGILFLPLASAALNRLVPVTSNSPE